MSKIVITGKRHEEVSWKRYITFEYGDEKHSVLLEWYPEEGYDLSWDFGSGLDSSRKEPAWASEWIDEDHEGMSLEHLLDELTYDIEDL